LAKDEDDLEYNIVRLNKTLRLYDMRISTDKSKATAVGRRHVNSVKISIDNRTGKLT
jgi:hypothetical protein